MEWQGRSAVHPCSHRHRASGAEAGGTATGSAWTEDGKRFEKKPEGRHKGGERTIACPQASKGNKGYDFTRLASNSPGN